jgi:hypothetical protein
MGGTALFGGLNIARVIGVSGHQRFTARQDRKAQAAKTAADVEHKAREVAHERAKDALDKRVADVADDYSDRVAQAHQRHADRRSTSRDDMVAAIEAAEKKRDQAIWNAQKVWKDEPGYGVDPAARAGLRTRHREAVEALDEATRQRNPDGSLGPPQRRRNQEKDEAAWRTAAADVDMVTVRANETHEHAVTDDARDIVNDQLRMALRGSSTGLPQAVDELLVTRYDPATGAALPHDEGDRLDLALTLLASQNPADLNRGLDAMERAGKIDPAARAALADGAMDGSQVVANQRAAMAASRVLPGP